MLQWQILGETRTRARVKVPSEFHSNVQSNVGKDQATLIHKQRTTQPSLEGRQRGRQRIVILNCTVTTQSGLVSVSALPRQATLSYTSVQFISVLKIIIL